MSLNVPPALIEQAEKGEVRLSDFLQCIKESLPYAWNLVEGLATRLQTSTDTFVDNQVPPPSEKERGQLLRMLASDSMRNAIEQHFGVKLAFQNCHRVALFRKDQLGKDYEEFITPRSQILNQTPELRDC
ncbi:hypothetical protein EI42_01521 [Thermosporothrix hazakensis]|jgi:hypothetical protein|uniref:Uncharacterized protein n=2 Tax=Thermosporothrix TaxID=768650 RepID=A0A326UC78_THEHA|nr:SCO5389 family protein [Thermosporothrix hazakensis]PZW32975.1 hypothetical protein EI42_01521 [Thermosporothrix hazakensis]BBH90957.1 hypothetical protein KTC_57080 [Thermosporothrix sp. COM3]GCE49007.1 hypothetical protein KTH_38760 [Thermosporothrix hazakensis]